MPYEEIDLNLLHTPGHTDPLADSTCVDLLIDFLNKHNLNDGTSPVYLHYNESRESIIISWPDEVPVHLRERR